MRDDETMDDISAIWASRFRPQSPVAERQKKEARGMKRRTSGRETKSVQLNIKITPSFKRSISAVAAARGMSVSECVEWAIKLATEGNAA